MVCVEDDVEKVLINLVRAGDRPGMLLRACALYMPMREGRRMAFRLHCPHVIDGMVSRSQRTVKLRWVEEIPSEMIAAFNLYIITCCQTDHVN